MKNQSLTSLFISKTIFILYMCTCEGKLFNMLSNRIENKGAYYK